MNESLAAIFDGPPGGLRLARLPRPRPAGREWLVRVVGCTLCGSDLHSLHGRRRVPVPTVLGHEIVGMIEAFGPDADHHDVAGVPLAVGDRVTWAVVAACGACLFCRRGLPQKCVRGVKYGHEPLRPGRELLGGLAEHCLLVEGTAVVRLPPGLALELACPASCATATAVAVCQAGDVPLPTSTAPAAGRAADRVVCVLGAGLLGLSAIGMAAAGGTTVVCVEPDAGRRDLAERCGATACCPPEEAAATVAAATEGHGVDAVLELSGAPTGWDAAWRLVRIGGRIVLAGAVVPVPAVALEPEQVVRRHVSIHGVHNYAPRHLVEAIAFLAGPACPPPLAGLVADWLPLQRVDEAVRLAAGGGVVRVGVRP